MIHCCIIDKALPLMFFLLGLDVEPFFSSIAVTARHCVLDLRLHYFTYFTQARNFRSPVRC